MSEERRFNKHKLGKGAAQEERKKSTQRILEDNDIEK